MESEQLMKLTEDIRKQLSRGNYQMDLDELPYTGQAHNVAAVLWEKGWRPSMAKSSVFREYHDIELRVWAQLFALESDIKREVDQSFEIFPEEDEREAYVAGLQTALVSILERLGKAKSAMEHWEDKETAALKDEGYSE